MAAENLLEIIIRANSAEAAAQIQQVRAALNGLGDSVSVVARQVAPAEAAVRTLGLSSQQTATVVRAVNSAMGQITPGQLPAVEAAVKTLGMSAEQTATAMRRIGTSGADTAAISTAMRQIGLSGEQTATVLGAVGRSLRTITPEQLPAVASALRQVGLSAEETNIAMRSLGGGGATGGLTTAFKDLGAAAFKTIGALSLIGFAAIEMRRSFDLAKASVIDTVNEIDRLRGVEMDTAIQMVTLSRGTMDWAHGMQYSQAVITDLRQQASELGVSFNAAAAALRAFVGIGAGPRNIQDIRDLVEISKGAAAFGIGRSGGGAAAGPEAGAMRMMMEIRALVDGTTSGYSRLAGILETVYGLNAKELPQWIAHERDHGKLIADIAAALVGVNAGYKDINSLISSQKTLLDDNKVSIMEMAGPGLYQGVQSAFQTINDWLKKNGTEIATVLKPLLDSLGQAAQNFADSLARPETIESLRTMATVLQGILTMTERIASEFASLAGAAAGMARPLADIIAGHPISAARDLAAGALRAAVAVPNVLTGGLLGKTGLTNWVGPAASLIEAPSAGPVHLAAPGPLPIPPVDWNKIMAPPIGRGGGGGGGGNEAFTVARDLIAEAAQHATSLADRIQDATQREAALAAIHQQEAQQYLQLAARTHDAAKAAELRLRAESLITQAINEQRQATRDSANEAKQAVETHVRASEDFLAHLQAMGQLSPQDRLAGLRRIEDQFLTPTIQAGQAPGATGAQQAAAQAALQSRKGIDELIHAQQREIDRQITADHKAALDEQLKAVQDHMSDLEAAGQLDFATKVALIHQEIALVQNAEDQKLIVKKDAIDKIAALDRELASAFAENQRQQAAASKQLASEMERDYKQLMAPIDSATKAVANSISSSFKTAFDDVIFGAKKGHSAILDLFQGIGKSIIDQATTMFARGITASLNIEPMLQGLFGPINKLAGGVGGPQEAMMRAEQMAHAAATTQHTSATIFQHAVEIFQTAVAKMTGTAPTGATPSSPTGPFTNIPGVPAATGGPLTGGPAGDIGELGGMIPGPIGGAVRTAASLWGVLSSLVGTGASGSLILRGGGGLVPGPLIPLVAAAEGGLFSRPTLALVAERGEREMVVPESKWGRAFGRSDGGDTHIYMISATDVASFEDRIAQSHRTIARSWARGLGLNSPNLRGVRS